MLRTVMVAVALVLIGVGLFLRSRSATSRTPAESESKSKSNESPASIYQDLRAHALRGSREAFALSPSSADQPVWGVLMETGYPEGTATLVCMTDGNASLYLSGGGGIIGGSGHEKVRRAATAFVTLANRHSTSMKTTQTFPLPVAGRTVFYFLTDNGVLTADALEDDLGEGRHALSRLFHAGHDVITELREVGETK